MNKESQTALFRKIKQRYYSFYKQEDKKRNHQLVDVNDETDFTQHDHFEIPTLEALEILTSRYDFEEIYPPHDYALVDYNPGGSPVKIKALNLDGSESPYYAVYAESRKDSNEINLSIVYGQMFNTVYPGNRGHHEIGQSANFGHIINFNGPLERDIYLKVHTYASIQSEKEKTFHLNRGNCGVELLGIEGYIQTGLYVPDNDERDTSALTMHKFLDVRETDDSRIEDFQPLSTLTNSIRVPAGVSEVMYTAGVRGSLYGSKDFSEISTLRNDQFGFAMLDLRHVIRGSQTPILRDPLGAWEKQAFGGVKFFISVEFFEAAIR